MPGVGPQFEKSPTDVPYPALAGLYPGHDGPVVENGMVLPWLSPSRAPLKFSVKVQTALDTDNNGKPDRLALRIVQPAEVADGLKTPVIVRPSIYYGDPTYVGKRQPFLGEDQYLRMGYTVVYADTIGSYQSEGCASIMDGAERQAMADVVRWLAGDPSAKGFDDSGAAVTAAWSTNHVAMEGISYGGTLPTMAAVTGVTGLEAIVPVDGISNAYDYFSRYNGVVPDELGVVTLNGYAKSYNKQSPPADCKANFAKLDAGVDDETLAYTDFWKERNTLALAGNIKAATLIAHGQSDNNVKTKNGVQLYQTLHQLKKPVQLWFHAKDHDDPAWQKEWQKQIMLWYSRYLFGVNNGVEAQPTYVRETPPGDSVAGDLGGEPRTDLSDTLTGHCNQPGSAAHNPRDCITSGGILVKEDAWPATKTVSYYLHRDAAPGTGLLLTPDAGDGSAGGPLTLSDSADSGSFATRPLVNATRFAGTIYVTTTVKFPNGATDLKAKLFVDGQAVTWGWANPSFYKSLEKPETIAPDTAYKVSLEMMPRDFTVLPGRKISLVIQAYNNWSGETISLDLANTTLDMPLVPKANPVAVMKLN
ncbi:prolyl oligopeptidase family serine peptidase [Variovorax sp. ZS18.2.2]|uniref:CocE/NonD family hydrolase n=1 Tax=Variovorax sp. ZS18.2.2 TaxID=2971255 RepID=UPI0021519181|nr:CocE/NonD family hydrolase [Variovorax sp. ZS18.2.2]MCR6480498.1 prolyl oligopeptidase family serine peptidase [Variovorax sp. ZS18.2.2]